MAMKVIDPKDFESLSPIFRGEKGYRRAERFMRIAALDKVNQVYDHSFNYTGARFAEGLLKDFEVNYVIGNAERLKLLPKGAFITVSNHPYGGLDGIILIDLMARIRPDYKLMVNRMLSLVDTMKDNFIPVTPVGNKKTGISGTSMQGVRETLAHIKDGHPVGFFPSGAVSDFRLKDFRVKDRKWQKSILRLIHSVKVPIVPIRFFDKNSPLFYFLGLINWKIRLLRMPRELFNKKHQKPRVGIGNIISVEEQKRFSDCGSLGRFLRKAVYEMPRPVSFVSRTMLNFLEKNQETELPEKDIELQT
jgi:putative hemolysin